MELNINEREALLIVTALGVYQNRVGQKSRWRIRKRLRTLRAMLADAITIADDTEANGIRKAIKLTNRRIERGIDIGIEISVLRQRIKDICGITDEKVNTDEDEEGVQQT